ncbi:hypothetical protein HOO68_04665 [Candidatus Gracilibacteria bacterium]|nr:hypothetical protein [Candidatus Gracilibacteria bacterium]
MEVIQNTFLKFIEFKEFSLWDVKRLFLTTIKSDYQIISLKEVIKERSEKISLFNFPNEKFGILGVNNKEGIFDAYEELGKNINQSYKKMHLRDIAYNPYRVNVGSVGIKLEQHIFDYISPAYVVFSCDTKRLLPEFFWFIFKSDLFNGLVQENTTGSVRQNLKFSTLAEIKIPLPNLEEQKRIIDNYQNHLKEADEANKKAIELEGSIEKYLMKELGIDLQRREKIINLNTFKVINFLDTEKWGTKYLLNSLDLGKILKSDIFPMRKLKELLEINPLTNFKKNLSISFIPMKYISDEYGEIMHQDIISGTESNGYTKFKEGDLIWSRITPCMQNGKSAIVKNLENGIGCGSTEYHVLRNSNSNIKLEYIYTILRLEKILKFAMNYFTGSAGQQRVPKEFLEDLQIPLPPIKIQEKIVSHITAMKDEIKGFKRLSENLKETAKMELERGIFN